MKSDPKTHDQRFWEEILSVLKVGDLLIFDKGYLNFSIFTQIDTEHSQIHHPWQNKSGI